MTVCWKVSSRCSRFFHWVGVRICTRCIGVLRWWFISWCWRMFFGRRYGFIWLPWFWLYHWRFWPQRFYVIGSGYASWESTLFQKTHNFILSLANKCGFPIFDIGSFWVRECLIDIRVLLIVLVESFMTMRVIRFCRRRWKGLKGSIGWLDGLLSWGSLVGRTFTRWMTWGLWLSSRVFLIRGLVVRGWANCMPASFFRII